MNKVYTNYSDLPITLSVVEIGRILNISKNNAYMLARSEGFPRIQIGKRIIVPKEAFISWLSQSKVVNFS